MTSLHILHGARLDKSLSAQEVENFRLHKLISPNSALPKYLMKQYLRGAGVTDVTMWHHAEGKWAQLETCLKKKEIYRLCPWASLTKMSLGGEDYGLIYNNYWRKRERRKNCPLKPQVYHHHHKNSVSSFNVPTNSPKFNHFRPVSV